MKKITKLKPAPVAFPNGGALQAIKKKNQAILAAKEKEKKAK